VNLISYLESVPGTPRMEPGDNPATWMLGTSLRYINVSGL
jgi:hypothetical protein